MRAKIVYELISTRANFDNRVKINTSGGNNGKAQGYNKSGNY